jgi:hypothetical protein
MKKRFFTIVYHLIWRFGVSLWATPFLLSFDTLNRSWVGRSRAPTGRPKIAQGNALGNMGRWMMEP